MQTIDTLLQQGIPTTSIDMTSLVSGIDANLSVMLSNIDSTTLNAIPQLLDLNQDGVIGTQDLQMVTQPINCEPSVEALAQTVLDQAAVFVNGKAPYILSDAQLAELGFNLQAAGVPADVTTALVNDAQTLVDVTLTEISQTGTEPVVFTMDPSMAKEVVAVAPIFAAATAPVVVAESTAAVVELTEATIIQAGTPDGTEPVVYSGVQADAGLAMLVEPNAPDGTEPVVYNDGAIDAVSVSLIEPHAPDGTAPVVYNGVQADAAIATLVEPHAPDGTEPVVYNDGQTGDAVSVSILQPHAPDGTEPVVYNDGQTGDSTSVSLLEPHAPNGTGPVVFDPAANAGQAAQVVDSWLEAHSGNPWINLTGAATGADAAGADSIKLTLHDLLAMPSDTSGMLTAKITGDASDTVNLSNVFGLGMDAPLGHWDVQGSVMQDGQSFTAYSFSGNAQMQVLVDDHIQHVNLG